MTKPKSVKGMHLWKAKFGYTSFLVLTRFRSPQVAAQKAQKAAREDGLRSLLEDLSYEGTIDA